MLDCASVACGDADEDKFRRVESVQDRALCRALGVNWHMFRDAVAAECGVVPMGLRRDRHLLRCVARTHSLPHHPVADAFAALRADTRTRHRRDGCRSLFERAMQLTESLHLASFDISRSEIAEIETSRWHTQWASSAGEHAVLYHSVRPEVPPNAATHGQQPLLRSAWRALASVWHGLRLRRAGLAHQLRSFGLAHSGACQCGYHQETVKHFLLGCSSYSGQRSVLAARLAELDLPLDCDTILGSDALCDATSSAATVFNATLAYIRATQRFDRLSA